MACCNIRDFQQVHQVLISLTWSYAFIGSAHTVEVSSSLVGAGVGDGSLSEVGDASLTGASVGDEDGSL